MDLAQQQMRICFFILCCLLNAILGGPHERRLLKHLLSEQQHNPLERPVRNDSQTLPVSMNLAIQQIVDFDEKNEILIMSGWMVLVRVLFDNSLYVFHVFAQMWQDYSMTWKPAEYGNIQTIRVPSSEIWTPDVFLYNSADDNFDGRMKINAVVQHTGDILYVPPGIFKSICPFSIEAFPFVCGEKILNFASRLTKRRQFINSESSKTKTGYFNSYQGSSESYMRHCYVGINLTAPGNKGQLDAYSKNAEWDLEDFSAVNNALKYDCCPDLYPFVLFTIRIRRRSLYYFTNVIMPCFLITCMTIFGYLLAPESGEKLTLQITILLSIVMFSLLISEIIPPSSTAIPIITKYFICVICMSTISVGASVMVISVHFRNANNHTMPLWVRKYICHYLAWLLCMKRPGHDLTWRSIRRQWAPQFERQNNMNELDDEHHYKFPSEPLLVNKQPLPFSGNREKQRSNSMLDVTASPVSKFQCLHNYHNPSKAVRSYDADMIRSELRTIVSQGVALLQHIREQDKDGNAAQDWQFVAMVIDRLCLIIFTVSMITFTSFTLFSAPNFFKFQ